MENKKYEWYGEEVTKEEYDKLCKEYEREFDFKEKMRLKVLDAVDYMRSYIESDLECNQEILSEDYEEDEKEEARQDIEFLNKMLKYIYKIQMENACQDC